MNWISTSSRRRRLGSTDACLLENTSAERIVTSCPSCWPSQCLEGVRQLDELELLSQVLAGSTALRGIGQSGPHHWPVLEHTLFVLSALENAILDARCSAPRRGGGDRGWDRPAPFVWSDTNGRWRVFRWMATHLAWPLATSGLYLWRSKLAARYTTVPNTRPPTVDDEAALTLHQRNMAPHRRERVEPYRLCECESSECRHHRESHAPQQLPMPGRPSPARALPLFSARARSGRRRAKLMVRDSLSDTLFGSQHRSTLSGRSAL